MNSGHNFNHWDDFDPIEYATRNYGRILPEDRTIITFVIDHLKKFPLRQLKRVVDAGAGPNFYPSMLLSPLISDDGSIELIEPSRPNRDFLHSIINNTDIYHQADKNNVLQSIDGHTLWQKFEHLMVEVGGSRRYLGTFERARAAAKCLPGSIFRLPEGAYDFVSSYFVAESITTDKGRCSEAIHSLMRSVKPGGSFMIAFMVGSSGWSAGSQTLFPATKLALMEIKHMFDAIPHLKHNISFIDESHKARAGYKGMAIAVGSRE